MKVTTAPYITMDCKPDGVCRENPTSITKPRTICPDPSARFILGLEFWRAYNFVWFSEL